MINCSSKFAGVDFNTAWGPSPWNGAPPSARRIADHIFPAPLPSLPKRRMQGISMTSAPGARRAEHPCILPSGHPQHSTLGVWWQQRHRACFPGTAFTGAVCFTTTQVQWQGEMSQCSTSTHSMQLWGLLPVGSKEPGHRCVFAKDKKLNWHLRNNWWGARKPTAGPEPSRQG